MTHRRSYWLLLALALLSTLPAFAHNQPGLHRIRIGQPFNFLSMKAILPHGSHPYEISSVQFDPLRGKALAFLVIDPSLPADLAEAHRFEKLARSLTNTQAFLVALPRRSLNQVTLAEQARREKFELTVLADNRDIFPWSFGFGMTESPHYELFDASWTLMLQNPAHLAQRLPTGLTVESVVRELDAGHTVEPLAVTSTDNRRTRAKR